MGSFGRQVHDARLRLGWTQQALARTAGVSLRTVRAVENGQAERLRPATRTCLAAALKIKSGSGAPEPALWIGALGPLVVRSRGTVLDVGHGHHVTLLGILALHAGERVAHDEVADILWSGRPPSSWRRTVHASATRLSRLLQTFAGRPVLLTAAGRYSLSVDEEELDILTFRGRGTDQEGAAAALQLWRGDVLANLSDRFANHPLAQALRDQRVATALSFAADATPEEAVGVLEPIAALVPLHEGVQARLMTALAGSGRQADAFALFQRVLRRLDDELGVRPGEELRIAHARLLGTSGSDVPADAVPAQLPAAVSSFTGRTGELAMLDALIPRPGSDDTAIVISAIAGTGGVGKTALAIHWAHRARHLFPDGQLYVNLRGYDPGQPADPRDVLTQFLHALGARETPPGLIESSALFRSLVAERRMLILLDNARSADQVRPLLPGTGSSSVVITSRDALRGLVARDGARRIELDVLDRSESTALLRALLGDRAIADEQATAELVTQCAGLPLALRLAADLVTRRPRSTLRDLVAELGDQHRLNRLDAQEDRYAALREVFSWSYQALAAEAAMMFRLLGAHPGPDTDVRGAAILMDTDIDAAQRLLDQLCGAHLLEEHEYGRYRSHDLLRAYAGELSIQDGPEPVDRLIDHYLHTAVLAEHQLDPLYVEVPLQLPKPRPDARPHTSVDTESALTWFAAEHSNVHAILDLCLSRHDHVRAVRLALATRSFHHRGGHWRCYRRTFEPAAAAAEQLDDAGSAALCHSILSVGMARLGDHTEALQHGHTALRLATTAENRNLIARAHRAIAWIHSNSNDHRAALTHCHQALDLARSLDATVLEADMLNGIGWQYTMLGEYQLAVRYCQEALDLARQTGDRDSQCCALEDLGVAYHNLGNHHEAARLLVEAVEQFNILGSHTGLITSLVHLGDAYHALKDDEQARAVWQQALKTIDDPSDSRVAKIQNKIAGAIRRPVSVESDMDAGEGGTCVDGG